MYTALAKTSLRLLTMFGQDIGLATTVTGEYDPETGTQPINESTTVRKGLFERFKVGESNIRGVLVQSGDRRLLLATNGVAPTTEDYVDASGVRYQIVSVDVENPAGTPVIYYLHLRET